MYYHTTQFIPRRRAKALAISGVVLGLSLLCGESQTPSAAKPQGATADKTLATKMAAGVVQQNFKPSFEAKENADFLLTPALLVQEAISGKCLITYPSE